MLHSPSSFEVSKPSLAGISRCVQEISSTPDARSAHSNIMLLRSAHSHNRLMPNRRFKPREHRKIRHENFLGIAEGTYFFFSPFNTHFYLGNIGIVDPRARKHS